MSDAWEQRLQQTVQQTWRSAALSLRQGGGLLRALAAEAVPWGMRTKRRGRERVLGIGAPIEIIRDRWGVPHCFAQSSGDVLFALGYVHAQDRLWQLQWNRRAALGRLAELVGPAGLPADRLTRTLGFAHVAQAAWDATAQAQRDELAPYIAGINAGAARMPRSFEAVMLGDYFRPWQPSDSVAWGKLLSFLLAPAWEQQLLRATIVQRAGVEALCEVDPPLRESAPVVTPPDAEYGRLARPAHEGARALAELLGLDGAASNNWAVAGSRTASGAPILACDPHLNPVTPAHAYFVHLHCPEFNAAGATVPGLPGIVWGYNERIAWGPTAAMQAMHIAVVEELDEAGDATRTPDGWAPIQRRTEQISVSGYDDETIELRTSVNGPIVSEVLADDRAPRWAPQRAISLHSPVLWPSQSGTGIVELMQATDWPSFSAAAAKLDDFNLAFAYADTDGGIGLRVSGAVPAANAEALRFPVPGWLLPEQGGVPRAVLRGDQLPHAFNPPGGLVVSANNPLTPAATMDFGAEYLDGWRAERIGGLLRDHESHTVERSAQIQLDQYSAPLHQFAGRLSQLDATNDEQRRQLEAVAAWDGVMSVASRPAAIVALSSIAWRRGVLRELLGPQADTIMSSLLAIPTLDLLGARAGSWALRRLEADDADGALAAALRTAMSQLRARFGPDAAAWTWGACRPVQLPHALSNAPIIGRMLSAGPWPFGGGVDTVCQSGVLGPDPFRAASAIPSLRLVVELSKPPRAQFVVAGEQAADPLHPAGPMTDAWLKGRLVPLLRDRAEIERERPRRLELRPR